MRKTEKILLLIGAFLLVLLMVLVFSNHQERVDSRYDAIARNERYWEG